MTTHLKIFSTVLADLHGGGTERVALNVANSFAQRRYAVGMVLMCAMPIRIELDPQHQCMVICKGRML